MIATRIMQTTALGLAGVALAAQVVGAVSPRGAAIEEPARGRTQSAAVRSATAAPAAPDARDVPSSAPALGPVVVTELPPGHRRTASPPPGTAQAVQTISVTIVGGDLTVEPSSAPLEVVDGRATIPAVTVVDARGALDGWVLCAEVAEAPRAKLRVVDSALSDVYGDGRGLHAPPGASGRLAFATNGHGGGTYRFTADVEFIGSDRFLTDVLTVHFDVVGGSGGC